MKITALAPEPITTIKEPDYPEMSSTLNSYLAIIKHWDDDKIKQVKTLALDAHDRVICEYRINVKHDDLLNAVSQSFEMAKKLFAAKVLVVQNEPVRHIYPGIREKAMARKIWAFARRLDLPIADQLVVSENGYYSYNENNVIQDK